MSAATATLGIDLASQAEKTAFCALVWGDGAATVAALSRGTHAGTRLHDKFLVTAIRGLRLDLDGVAITKTAIDAPFGWPQPFADAVASHNSGNGWPSGLDNKRAPFERRETDRVVYEHARKLPLSVSTDRIAFPAMRCAVLLTDLQAHHGPAAVDRLGGGLVCEAYPDPALRHWTAGSRGLGARESYKGPLRADRRRGLTSLIADRVPLHDPQDLLESCAVHDDCLDALVCALVARALELGHTLTPRGPEQEHLGKTEGWIHLPTCELSELSAIAG